MLRELYNIEAIQNRVSAIAQEISAYYGDQPFVVICVLKGAVMFYTDLVRHFNQTVEMDFIQIHTYVDKDETIPDELELLRDITMSIRDRHVLIVDDIVDSGNTIEFVYKTLKARQPRSLEVCALLKKPKYSNPEFSIRFAGFMLQPVDAEDYDVFFVGYGIDLNEKYRCLNGIYHYLVPIQPESEGE